MRSRATIILLAALRAGAGAFTWQVVRNGAEPAVHEPELRWLQREFGLSGEVLLRVTALHRRYRAEREPLCKALRASEAEMRRLMRRGTGLTTEVATALKHHRDLAVECQHRLIEYLYAVANEMPPRARERFLALMTPIAAHPDRDWASP